MANVLVDLLKKMWLVIYQKHVKIGSIIPFFRGYEDTT
jgi:hypothetical protein